MNKEKIIKKLNIIKSIIVIVAVVVCGAMYVMNNKLDNEVIIVMSDNVYEYSESNENDIEKDNDDYEKEDDEEIENIKKDITKNEKIININTASAEELDKLPRVGPSTAKNIIESRVKQVGCDKKEEIKRMQK